MRLCLDVLFKMLYLIATVTEGVRCVLPEQIITITENTQFAELYEIFTFGQFNNQGVEVYVRQNKIEKWIKICDGLRGDLNIMKVLGYNNVKFALLIESAMDIIELPEPPRFPDAFNIIMRNAQQLKFSQYRTEHTRRDLLFN